MKAPVFGCFVWLGLLANVSFSRANASAADCVAQPAESLKAHTLEVDAASGAPCPIIPMRSARSIGFRVAVLTLPTSQSDLSDATWLTLTQARALLDSGIQEEMLIVGSGFDDAKLSVQCSRLLPDCAEGQCKVLQGGFMALAEGYELAAPEALVALAAPDSALQLESAAPISAELVAFLSALGKTHKVVKNRQRSSAPNALWLTSTGVPNGGKSKVFYAIRGGQVEFLQALKVHQALRSATYQSPKTPCYQAQ